MKINVRKVSPDVFSITLDDQEFAVDQKGLATLHREIERFIHPFKNNPADITVNFSNLLTRLRHSDDLAIQTLIAALSERDTLIFLKSCEQDLRLQERIFQNMSERSAQMAREDLKYRFKSKLPRAQAEAAFARILEKARQLASDDRLKLAALP